MTRRPAVIPPTPPRAGPGTGTGAGVGGRVDTGEEDLLTVPEVLQHLRVPRSTWYRWRQTGKTPPVIKLPNGQLRVRATALAAWLHTLEDHNREETR